MPVSGEMEWVLKPEKTGEKPQREGSAGGATGRHGASRKPAGATSANRKHPDNAGAGYASSTRLQARVREGSTAPVRVKTLW